MLNAVIIDDEEISLTGLSDKIKKYCPSVNVVRLFSRAAEALKEMQQIKPDVVFLDIEMPKINGFNFLQQYGPVDFEVIFTTAYSQYAIDALRISALDFLLKPVDPKELVAAVEKLQAKQQQRQLPRQAIEQQLQLLLQSVQAGGQAKRIALPVINGLEFIEAADIIKVEADNVYSVFHLSGQRKIVVTRTLKEAEKMLGRWNFMRVHKSFIINLDYITQYIKGEGGTVILSDGSEVEVSRRSKHEFLERIKA